MREDHEAKALHTLEAIGGGGLDLAAGHGKDRAAEGLGEVGAVDETQGDHARRERVDLDVFPFQVVGERRQPGLQAVEDQQHQHQVGYPTNQRGVGLCRNAQQCKF
ncbi:hypothetical protein D3C80_713970 [compost metagenome]